VGRRIKPGPGRILVEPFARDEQLDVGDGKKLWVIQDTSSEGIMGTVVGVHGQPYLQDGVQHDGDYKVGDVVIVGKFTGTRLSVDRKTFLVVPETSVLAELINEPDQPDPAPSNPGSGSDDLPAGPSHGLA
jgi:chaperonin GroES